MGKEGGGYWEHTTKLTYLGKRMSLFPTCHIMKQYNGGMGKTMLS